MQGVVAKIHDHNEDSLTIDFASDGVLYPHIEISRHQFGKERLLPLPELKGLTPFDYAYAITCHKAQGSEWDSVLVYEPPPGKYWSHERWTYTAASRPRKVLAWVARGGIRRKRGA
jgi:hypothetical protein